MPEPVPSTRGTTAVPGIDRIPLNSIKATNGQMKDMFAIFEAGESFDDDWHARNVRSVACNSYIVECDDSESFHGYFRYEDEGAVTRMTGSAPYTFVGASGSTIGWTWMLDRLDNMRGLKIVSSSAAPGVAFAFDRKSDACEPNHPIPEYGCDEQRRSDLPPYLIVQGAGNSYSDSPLDGGHEQVVIARTKRVVAANKLLFVAGWDRDSRGNYIQHALSSHCRENGISDGCLWAQFEFSVGGGTSYSTPQVAAALASVLAVFPDTTHQNLAKFAKACARKTGNGIPTLLRISGGVGVADFTCMGGVTGALANLPTSGRTSVSVNGQSVSVGRRDVALSFAPSFAFLGREEASETASGLSFDIVPTGRETVMMVGTRRMGDMFTSLVVGTREDFFGFTESHDQVRQVSVTAGHRNVFAHFSNLRSSGAGFIESAEGKSVGLTVREEFYLTGAANLTISLQNDQFIGGSARIGRGDVSFGNVSLNRGGWHHRLDIASDIALDESKTVNLAGTAAGGEGQEGEEFMVNARFRWAF